MPDPEISVLLPARNAAATLDAALRSLVIQSEPRWECVVIDDHSTDGTPELSRQWARRDPRVRVLGHPGRGIVAALNAALEAARAPLLARLDADDICEPRRLELQKRWLQQHPEAGLVSCRVRFGGNPHAAAGYARYVDWLNSVITPEEIYLARFIESPLAHPSVMFRRELVERFGGYREGEFPEDYELWLRWMRRGVRCGKAPEVLLHWNDPPERLSRRDARYAVSAFYALKCRYFLAWWERRHAGRELWLWGAGRVTRRRFTVLEEAELLAGFVDVDPRKIGARLGKREIPVIAPDDLGPPGERFVLGGVGARGARASIGARLRELGYVEGRDYLHAA
jgi:glycosyltransferase involved in cell wall biosynthesis